MTDNDPMTAPSMAEVLAKHRLLAASRGVWRCSCYEWLAVVPTADPDEVRKSHDAHVAQALAAAGFGHVASVERERDAILRSESFEVTAAEAERDALRAQVEAVRSKCEPVLRCYRGGMDADTLAEQVLGALDTPAPTPTYCREAGCARAEAAERERDSAIRTANVSADFRVAAAESKVAAVRALLDGSPMVPQEMVRRALDGEGGR